MIWLLNLVSSSKRAVLVLFCLIALVSGFVSGGRVFAEEVNSADAAKPVEAGVGPASVTEAVKSFFGAGTASPDESPASEDVGPSASALEGEATEMPDPNDYLTPEELKSARPWAPTDFAKQVGALGWSETTFDTPAGMKDRVAFWRDIYTKYSTDQGVLHDSIYINVVYMPLDFSEIMHDSSLSPRKKAKARTKLVKAKKAEIVERLKRLNGRKNADGLTGEDLRVWKMFDDIGFPDRFKDASAKGRVRFQLGQRDKFVTGIFHSGRYLNSMEKIFREEGLPIELTRLPFVESSFNIRARSRVGASGIWQFMRRTAKPYMKVNNDTDERNDPLKATRASARMLRANYQLLQSWPLALTGYNHGPSGVKRIADKVGTRDLAKIIVTYSSRTFGFASENFYACFLAALDAEKNAKKYFGEVKWGPESKVSEIKLTKAVPYKTLLEFFDGDKMSLDLANPHLSTHIRKGRAPVPVRSYVRVPTPKAEVMEEWLTGKMTPSKLTQALTDAMKATAEINASPDAKSDAKSDGKSDAKAESQKETPKDGTK